MGPIKTYTRKPFKSQSKYQLFFWTIPTFFLFTGTLSTISKKPKKKLRKRIILKQLPEIPDVRVTHDSLNVDPNDTFDKLFLNKNEQGIHVHTTIHSSLLNSEGSEIAKPLIKQRTLEKSIDNSLSYYQESHHLSTKSLTYSFIKPDSFNQISLSNYSTCFNQSKFKKSNIVSSSTPLKKVTQAPVEQSTNVCSYNLRSRSKSSEKFGESSISINDSANINLSSKISSCKNDSYKSLITDPKLRDESDIIENSIYSIKEESIQTNIANNNTKNDCDRTNLSNLFLNAKEEILLSNTLESLILDEGETRSIINISSDTSTSLFDNSIKNTLNTTQYDSFKGFKKEVIDHSSTTKDFFLSTISKSCEASNAVSEEGKKK